MKRFLVSEAIVLLVLSLSVPAFSQGFFSTVTGTVTDTSGALIPGVTVKATAVDTGVVTNTVTNESGAYTFGNLLPGKYTIGASLPGNFGAITTKSSGRVMQGQMRLTF